MSSDIYHLARTLGINPSLVRLVGSRLICGQGKDSDYLCLVSREAVEEAGFEPDLTDNYPDSDFTSYRKGDVNIIQTTDVEFFLSEATIAEAARVARQMGLDLSDRDRRVFLHAEVRQTIKSLREDLMFFKPPDSKM